MDTRDRFGIISAASWTVDRVKLVDAWPQEEHLAEIIGTDLQGGGSAHNLGVDIRRLNSALPVEGIGVLGRDADGDFLIGKIRECGIDASQMHRIEGATTSFTDVISDVGTGRRTFFHHRGTNDVISPDHFDFSKARGRILHLGLLGLHKAMDGCNYQSGDGETESDSDVSLENGWVKVLKAAREAGIESNVELVSITPERIREIVRPCLPYLDTLVVNEFEAGALAGLPTVYKEARSNISSNVNDAAQNLVDMDLCRTAAEKIMSMGGMSLIVVHFPAGAIALTRAGEFAKKESFKIAPSLIKSAVGAGDAFSAGILYGRHEGWAIDDSLELAHAVAAASLRATNTVGAVESVEECLRFARDQNSQTP